MKIDLWGAYVQRQKAQVQMKAHLANRRVNCTVLQRHCNVVPKLRCSICTSMSIISHKQVREPKNICHANSIWCLEISNIVQMYWSVAQISVFNIWIAPSRAGTVCKAPGSMYIRHVTTSFLSSVYSCLELLSWWTCSMFAQRRRSHASRALVRRGVVSVRRLFARLKRDNTKD